MSNSPLVSICCITYNHHNFIRDAIEGFLMQKTSFIYEIIIHDDASVDGTTEIVRQYAKNYPDLIFPIIQSENQYSKEPASIEVRFVWPHVRGKYIALCQGDDYWIDPYKLQKQVDFMEENEEFGLVHGDCNFYFQDKKRWEYNANKTLANKNIISSKEEIFNQLINSTYRIRTATVVFRKELLGKINPNEITFIMSDTPTWLDFSQYTKFKYFDEVFSVYRIIGESASRSVSLIRQKRFNLSKVEMRIYYLNKYGYPVSKNLRTSYNKALLTYKLLDKNFKELYPYFDLSGCQKIKSLANKNELLRQLLLIKFRIKSFRILLNRTLTKICF